jgi:hypothetical protein
MEHNASHSDILNITAKEYKDLPEEHNDYTTQSSDIIQSAGYVILSKSLHILPGNASDHATPKKVDKPIHQTRVIMSDTYHNDETIMFCPTAIKLLNDKYFMVNGTLLLNFSKNKEHMFSTHHVINATVFGGKIVRLSVTSPENAIQNKYEPFPPDLLVDIKCNIVNNNFVVSISQNINIKSTVDALLDMECIGTQMS